MRVEHEAAVGRRDAPLSQNWSDLVGADLIDVDHAGVTARAIADEA